MIEDFRDHSLRELVRLVRERQVTAVELVTLAFRRIEAANGALNAWASLDQDLAISQARAIDGRIAAEESVGALAGLPIGVKDMEDAEGFRTGFGSRLHADDPPARRDSVLTGRLRQAGAIVIGKTTTPEHGWAADTTSPHWGVTQNPWQIGRSPGGSSGGTAAAIASGMVPLATGSDGGGSIRIPAALCGLSAIKTTNGLIPIGGSAPSGAGPLAVRGPITRRIGDTAYVLDVCTGPDPTDIYSVPTAERFSSVSPGLPSRVLWAPAPDYPVDAEVGRVLTRAIEHVESTGVEVVVIDELFRRPPLSDWYTIWCVLRERAQGHLRPTPEWVQVDPGLREQMNHARYHVTATDFAKALDGFHDANYDIERHFERAPLLLLPTVAGQTPANGEWGTVDDEPSPYWAPFPPVFNMTRHPAGTVCAGYTADGMPVGLQAVTQRHADRALIAAMLSLEELLDEDRRPPEVRP